MKMAVELRLDAILEDIFMVELEKAVVPTTVDVLLKWTWYEDETSCFVKNNINININFILSKLDSFHPNFHFKFEVEKNRKVTVVDVIFFKKTTTLQRKLSTGNGQIPTYLNSKSFLPNS